MKDLSQYPTPETDDQERTEYDNLGSPYTTGIVDADVARNLERRLTACREFIRNAIDFSHIQETDKQSAEDLLAATAPKP
jgi:hypothetical protein